MSQCDNVPKDEDISRTEARGQGYIDSKAVCDTPQPQDVFQLILMILVSKFMVHRDLFDKTYLS